MLLPELQHFSPEFPKGMHRARIHPDNRTVHFRIPLSLEVSQLKNVSVLTLNAWAKASGIYRKREGTQTATDMMTDEVQPPGNYFILADVLSGLPRVLYKLLQFHLKTRVWRHPSSEALALQC